MKKKIFLSAIILVIFIFIFRIIFINLEKIKEFQWRFNLYYLSVTLLILVIYCLLLSACWMLIVRSGGKRGKISRLIRSWLISCLPRYVPGGVWHPLTRIYFGVKDNVDKVWLLQCFVIESICLISAFTIIYLIGYFYYREYTSIYSLKSLFAIFSIIIILVIISGLFNFFRRILKKIQILKIEDFEPCYKTYELIKFICYYLIPAPLLGTALFMYTRSLIEIELTMLPVFVSTTGIAYVIGFITYTAPAGIGVREGILIMLLKDYIPVYIISPIVVSFRIIIIITEVFLGSISYLIEKRDILLP
ncbi:MAG: hypothetical protein AB1765_00290 [Candidatus Hydrogenedentota bacterium]